MHLDEDVALQHAVLVEKRRHLVGARVEGQPPSPQHQVRRDQPPVLLDLVVALRIVLAAAAVALVAVALPAHAAVAVAAAP